MTLRSYRQFKWGPRRCLWRNSVFSKVGDLNPATLLRIELLCGNFSKGLTKLSEDFNSSRIEDLIALTSSSIS